MVDVVSMLLGIGLVVGLAILVASAAFFYVFGQRSVSESTHYVNTHDVETYRANAVRDVEQQNTENAIRNDRPNQRN
jgi:hypothetical protein